jgi:hypothetical protein
VIRTQSGNLLRMLSLIILDLRRPFLAVIVLGHPDRVHWVPMMDLHRSDDSLAIFRGVATAWLGQPAQLEGHPAAASLAIGEGFTVERQVRKGVPFVHFSEPLIPSFAPLG